MKVFNLAILPISLICISSMITACGQAQAPRKATELSTALKSLQLKGLKSNESSEYSCPPIENVKVKDGLLGSSYDYSGSFEFTVCVHRENKAAFRIISPDSAHNICIYPMHHGYSSEFNSYLTRPVESPRCFQVDKDDFLDVDFSSQDINYMRIIDIRFTGSMNQCLLDLSGHTTCPTNAEGFVQ